MVIERRPSLQVAEIHTWFTQALHGHQADHCAGPLGACCRTTCAAKGRSFSPCRQIGLF